MKVAITLKNSKLGGHIPTVNLPPIKTCRQDAPCSRYLCYALKGTWLYPNVRKSLENNYLIYKYDRESYFNQIIQFLSEPLIEYKYFRWHSSGDIIDSHYLKGMVKVAKSCPKINFLCFTKKFELVNMYLYFFRLPKNLHIVLSAWDKDFKLENPHKLPVTYVNFKDKEKNPDIPKDSINCIGKCPECLGCWSLKKGQSVVFNQH